MDIAHWIRRNCKFAKPAATPARAPVTRYPQRTEEQRDQSAETYFNMGHGDDADERGKTSHVVWVLMSGDIETAPGDSTHGAQWGHDYCDTTWKGRYEGDTGRLSVVIPCGAKSKLVPSSLLDKLEQQFGYVSEVHVF